ncbi:ABC transporter substrate-binding protein [Desulfosediminicola ganghwensis]|uniref:ABC transporter substrate-binding protein n=1 Tax=Desulfosediminicola ganghwensis TaxID=2569540 RepID=UPI0010ABA434|nr:ABC transporter substrate-binding protein [Desulfosediminicola ganghwensis]
MGSYRLVRLMLICIGFSVLFFTSSCEQPIEKAGTINTSSQGEKKATKGGGYHVPLPNSPTTLDPAYVQDQYGTAVVQQLFDGLVRFDPYLLVLPALAETWQVEEKGKSYRFTLQKNAHFHNGDKVTAEDVIFSLSRLLRVTPSPATLPHLLKIRGAKAYHDHQTEVVAGLQAIDDHTVLIQLEEPHAPFLTALGMYQAKIVPKTEVLKSEEDFGRNPVGSGPFRFVTWEPDNRIQLERFPDYFAGEALLDEVEYKIYPGVGINQILADFQKGELDEMLVFGNIRNELSSLKDLQWFHRPALSLLFYGLNVDHPNLDNPELRRKLSAAIDREKLQNEVYGGQFEPAERILPPGMPGVSREDNRVGSVANGAVGLMLSNTALEEGNSDVLSVEIVSASKSAFAQAELNYVRQVWAELGIDLTIKYITDWSRFEAYINSDKVQIYRYAWFADMPDPDSFFYPLFASSSPANFMGFKDEKVNRLLLSARGESDPAERTVMYREIEELIMESTPIIPLIYLSVDRVYTSHVQGARPSALGAHYMPLHRVWIKNDTPTQ